MSYAASRAWTSFAGSAIDAGSWATGAGEASNPAGIGSATASSIGRIASGPRSAIAETKRRILLDRERSFGALFAEEERALREALLGDEPDSAA